MTKLIVASRNLAKGPQNTIKETDTIFHICSVIGIDLSERKIN
jgi:hypothetical protein